MKNKTIYLDIDILIYICISLCATCTQRWPGLLSILTIVHLWGPVEFGPNLGQKAPSSSAQQSISIFPPAKRNEQYKSYAHYASSIQSTVLMPHPQAKALQHRFCESGLAFRVFIGFKFAVGFCVLRLFRASKDGLLAKHLLGLAFSFQALKGWRG